MPKPTQVKLIPEACSEPTRPPQTDIAAAAGQHGEANPFLALAPGHRLIKLHSSSWDHKNTAVKLNGFRTPPLKSTGFIGIAQGWFSRRFSAYVLAWSSVGKGTAQKQSGEAENRRLRKKKQRFVVFYLDSKVKLL